MRLLKCKMLSGQMDAAKRNSMWPEGPLPLTTQGGKPGYEVATQHERPSDRAIPDDIWAMPGYKVATQEAAASFCVMCSISPSSKSTR